MRLRRAGISASTFGYFVSTQDFESIAKRLSREIEQLAARGDYIVVGHSLGGVLLRAALSALPAGVAQPRHVFLLGSPVQPARLAIRLANNPLYRLLTSDCGALLGSASRMASVAPIDVASTAVVGVRGIPLTRRQFGDEANDGVVAISEVSADWQHAQVQLAVIHTALPASSRVADIILQRLSPDAR
jgi:pimeloyl-ACP methyl ester carboxylesterase